MGCDFYVKVGPVVVIHNPPIDTTEKHKSCCNDKCKQFHKYGVGKFCPDCGSPIEEWSKSVFKSLDIDFIELLKETLTPADYEHSDAVEVILVPNKRSKEVGFQSFNLEGPPVTVFPKLDEITGNIEKFKTIFAGELTKLKTIFGESNVEVRYGTIGVVSC